MLKQNKIVEHIHNTLSFPCEKSKAVSFVPSRIKYIAVCHAPSRFPVKLICSIAPGSASNVCYLHKFIAIILQ